MMYNISDIDDLEKFLWKKYNFGALTCFIVEGALHRKGEENDRQWTRQMYEEILYERLQYSPVPL